MKARTRITQPHNDCEIYFCYEDYDGTIFRSYDELVKDGREPFVLCGYLYSSWFNASELIDELDLSTNHRPTRAEIVKFIEGCKRIIND